MAYQAQKIGTVPKRFDVYQVAAPLHEQLRAFADVDIQTLTAPDEIAEIRLAGVSNDYSRTSIAPIALKRAKTILIRDSPLMNPLMAAAAVSVHANGNYFEASRSVYEQAEALAKSQESLAPEDRTALVVSQTGDFSLTPEMPESQFLLKKHAKPYFDKFTQGTISFYDIAASSKNAAVINYLWFYGPLCGSNLDCGVWGLGGNGWAFGVSPISAEGSAKNSGYTLTEIRNANSKVIPVVLRESGVPALESMLAKPLTKRLVNTLRSR